MSIGIIKKVRKIPKAIGQWFELRNMPLRLEFVVTDYCNLNCKGCSHYSPLAKKEFESLESLESSMRHLGEVCRGDVKKVYLIGGETLLYPDLVEAMKLMRKYFTLPVEAHIFTNGIALPKMSDEFWKVAKELDYIMSITLYPIKFDFNSAIALCESKGVKTSIFDDRSNANSFFRFKLNPKKNQNGAISHFKCYNRGCISIIGNRLYPCPLSACVGHLNKACGTDFRHEEGDWLDVDKITSAKEIIKFRNHPVPFCKYCDNPPAVVDYGPSRRDVGEWVDEG